ncbi:hypothetical protein BH09PSE4_BH09PSE4_19240 [soil metagenome]
MVEAVQAAGHLIGGIGAYEAGKFNKKVADVEAVNDLNDGVAEEARIRDAARMAIGDQVSAQGSNGFQMGTGSALEALTQSQVNATMDALNARRRATAAAQGKKLEGELALSAGKNAMVQGMFGAATSVVGNRVDWASAKAGQSGSYGGARLANGSTARSGPLWDGP